ncbi:MAG TPA: hypothetical protein VF483_02255, partial [Gemmatimonadaceae bacterium]
MASNEQVPGETSAQRLRLRAALDRFADSRAPIVVVCVLALIVFARLLNAPYLTWDDDKNIFSNPYYLFTGWGHLWLQPYFGLYVPVISTIWALLYKAGSASTLPFRVFNATVHVLNAALVATLLSKWFARRSLVGPSANLAIALGVAVFALHPLQTAAVSWISGGRDLAATAFGLGAILLGLRTSNRSFAAATALFALGLLCKPSIAGIPLALAAHDAVIDRPNLMRTMRRMALWCVLVVAAVLATNFMQSEMVQVSVPLMRRPFVAADAMGFYLAKIVWPVSLSGDYGRSPANLWSHRELAVPTLSALAVAVLLMWRLRRHPAAQVWGWTWFLAVLPVLGFVTFAFQRISTVTDHYMYLPLVAVAGGVAVAAYHIRNRVTQAGLLVAAVLAMSIASWQRVGVWRSSESFFTDVLARNPTSYSALTNLSQIACERGEFDWGLQLTARSLAANPAEAATYANEAYCLYHRGTLADVVALLPKLRQPDVAFSLEHNATAASSLANTIAGAYFALGDQDRGARFLCQ